MNELRCVNTVREQISPKMFKQIITEYSLKNGHSGTEIITKLDSKGNKGVRNILKNAAGDVEKVVDDVYGRHEEYLSACPDYQKGVYMYTFDNVRAYLPNVSLEQLSRY